MAGLGSTREPTAWRAWRAWRLASPTGRISVVVCPDRGGRIVSLVDGATGREWLVQAPSDGPLRPLTYGSARSAYERCGWEEVFPTIGECAHPGPGRAAGRRLPEHGEGWSLPWDDEAGAAAALRGAALPYVMRRAASIEGDSLVLDYRVFNEGPDPLPFQWVTHPLLAGEFEVESGPGWCRATARSATARSAASPAAGAGGELVGDPGGSLLFEWDVAELPWTASLGGLTMPATGAGADLEEAVAAGRVLVILPSQSARWTLRTTVGG